MRASLSLCMIVKNEESVIAECLESVRELVDQIVVVDTGSTDGTVNVCEKYGAEVYYYEWCDDFSAARNESIKYAKGDWILWMDADERLDPGSVGELRSVLKPENKPVAYKVLIKNIKSDGSFYFSDAHRIFKNGVGIRFSGIIHEQVSPSVLSLGGELRDTKIVINHLGYSYTGEKEQKKRERNRKLLLEYVRKEPKNAYAHYTLGQFYALNKDFSSALKHYLIAYRLNQFDRALKCSLLNVISESYIELEEYSRAMEFAAKSRSLCPNQVACYYLLYKISEKQGRHSECLGYLDIILEKLKYIKEGGKEISTDVVVDEKRVLYTSVLCGVKVGDVEKVRCTILKILELEDVEVAVLDNLFRFSMELSIYSVAIKVLEKLYNVTKDKKYLELMGIVYIKAGEFENAIGVYKRLHREDPTNGSYIRKLAGLYGKIGDLESAGRYVKLLNG